jgi:hypothetical protein
VVGLVQNLARQLDNSGGSRGRWRRNLVMRKRLPMGVYMGGNTCREAEGLPDKLCLAFTHRIDDSIRIRRRGNIPNWL